MQVNELVSNWASGETTGSSAKASLLASLAALLQHHLLGSIILFDDAILTDCGSCQHVSGTLSATASNAVVTAVLLRTGCKPKTDSRYGSSDDDVRVRGNAAATALPAAEAVHRAPPRKATGIFNHPENAFIVLQLAKLEPTNGSSVSGEFLARWLPHRLKLLPE